MSFLNESENIDTRDTKACRIKALEVRSADFVIEIKNEASNKKLQPKANKDTKGFSKPANRKNAFDGGELDLKRCYVFEFCSEDLKFSINNHKFLDFNSRPLIKTKVSRFVEKVNKELSQIPKKNNFGNFLVGLIIFFFLIFCVSLGLMELHAVQERLSKSTQDIILGVTFLTFSLVFVVSCCCLFHKKEARESQHRECLEKVKNVVKSENEAYFKTHGFEVRFEDQRSYQGHEEFLTTSPSSSTTKTSLHNSQKCFESEKQLQDGCLSTSRSLIQDQKKGGATTKGILVANPPTDPKKLPRSATCFSLMLINLNNPKEIELNCEEILEEVALKNACSVGSTDGESCRRGLDLESLQRIHETLNLSFVPSNIDYKFPPQQPEFHRAKSGGLVRSGGPKKEEGAGEVSEERVGRQRREVFSHQVNVAIEFDLEDDEASSEQDEEEGRS